MKAIRRPQPQGKFLAFTLLISSVLLGFAALTVDIGVLAAARSQLKTVADAGALAGARQLVSDARLSTTYIPTTEVANAKTKATAIAQANTVLSHAAVIQTSDLQVGYKQTWQGTAPNQTAYYDPTDATWKTVTDPTTNSVRLTATRDASHGGLVPAYFSRIWGNSGSSASVTSTATVEVDQIGGFTAGSTPSNILPFAMLRATYQAMFNTPITDNYSYSPSGGTYGTVTAGHDGEPEALLYPKGTTAGNYGTVNIPSGSSNSTATLNSQITNGIPPADVNFPSGGFSLSGDTGISAGIKSSLSSIIGKPVAVMLYDSVAGNGNNAMYTTVAANGPPFAAVRIVNVDFQGSNKNVVIQPALLTDPTATPGPPSTSWSQGGLVRLHLSR